MTSLARGSGGSYRSGGPADKQVSSHGWVLLLSAWLYAKMQRILWGESPSPDECLADTVPESVTPLPGLGIQLSSTRGLQIPFCSTRLPISTSHTFIPLSDISTIIINEGLTRWSVKHYLAVVKSGGQGVVVALDVSLTIRVTTQC